MSLACYVTLNEIFMSAEAFEIPVIGVTPAPNAAALPCAASVLLMRAAEPASRETTPSFADCSIRFWLNILSCQCIAVKPHTWNIQSGRPLIFSGQSGGIITVRILMLYSAFEIRSCLPFAVPFGILRPVCVDIGIRKLVRHSEKINMPTGFCKVIIRLHEQHPRNAESQQPQKMPVPKA